jgi:DNA-binding NtrC family response regulator
MGPKNNPPTPSEASGSAMTAQPIRVLLVEDDAEQCRMCAAELSSAGYRVRTAHDGREALKACDQEMPDIVVSDINMPGMDGINAMEGMIGKNNRLPIILFTSYGGYKESYRSWSTDAYLIKSSDLTELKNTIQRVLEDRRRIKAHRSEQS